MNNYKIVFSIDYNVEAKNIKEALSKARRRFSKEIKNKLTEMFYADVIGDKERDRKDFERGIDFAVKAASFRG